jgi:aryl-alcohol dehydrogenase-like predicted oxidoreductase
MVETESHLIIDRTSLGVTNIRISPLGIGTWQWGDRMFWNYGQGEFSDDDLHAGFQAALSGGINFFDTAESYGSGHSETLLGEFIRSAAQQPGPAASEIVVATKFMPYPWRLSRKELLAALRRSLKRLGLERVDLYQVHQPIPPLSPETWAAGLADAAGEGLVRAVGVSNYSEDWMRRAHETLTKRGISLASNQVEYSLLVRDPEWNGVMKACRELKVTLIAYSPLGKGLLTGKYTPENPPKGNRRFMARRYLKPVQPLVGLMREIGQKYGGKTPAQVALNWLISKEAVPIPGFKNLRQAQENLGALGWRLTKDEIAALEEIKI